MPTNIKPLIRKILLSNWSAPDIKVYLWYWIIAGPEYRETPISPEVISKIATATGLTVQNASLSLRILNLLPPTNVKSSSPDTPINPSINSGFVQALIKHWIQYMEYPLTLSEKIDFAALCDKFPEGGLKSNSILDKMNNFFNYQTAFQGVTITDRSAAYLFRNSFRSFLNNFEKFGDKFPAVLAEHQARYKAFKEKPVSYGYSSDPIEDRKLAEEEELQNICLALNLKREFSFPIVFPNNMAYYQKALKKLEKKKEKSK
jgi:hypothetical protein